MIVQDAEIVDYEGLVLHVLVQGSRRGDLLDFPFVLLLPAFAPEGIEGEFAGGIFSFVGDHVIRVEVDAFTRCILEPEEYLFRGCFQTATGVRGPPGGFRFAFEPRVDVLFEQPFATLSEGKVVHFVYLENMVPFLDGLEKFEGAPRASDTPLNGSVFAQPGSVCPSFGQFFFHARRQRGKVIFPLQRYGSTG